MIVKNSRDGRTLEIDSATWEVWKKLGRSYNWRVIQDDKIEVKKPENENVSVKNIDAFLSGKKKQVVKPVEKESIKQNNGK